MSFRIERLNRQQAEQQLDALAAVLHNCVQNGASVNFVNPFSLEDARSYWINRVLGSVDSGIVLLAAFVGDSLAGTVQLHPAQQPNGRYRAEVAKLLVHSDFRKRGIASALMQAVEQEALHLGRLTIMLDTVEGCDAERLYSALGYQIAGRIPRFALDVSGQRLETTTIFYKVLAERS